MFGAFFKKWARLRAWLAADRGDGCPRCGNDLIGGFGVAGGGYGPWYICARADCQYFIKRERESE